jgi:hypothetical protein
MTEGVEGQRDQRFMIGRMNAALRELESNGLLTELLEVLKELILKDETEFCLDTRVGGTNKTAFQNVAHLWSNVSVNCFDLRPTEPPLFL